MSQAQFQYEVQDNVVIWDLSDWTGDPDEIADIKEQWVRAANKSHITATVTKIGGSLDLGSDTQSHIAEIWTDLAEGASLEKSAVVSDRIKAMAVQSNLDTGDFETGHFETVDEAVDWAQD
ncbi:hypothetical protein [Halobacterium jilantaiense]|uniref:SpoIIAA-like n=1 Tax=Halobacterium jilantaiense TaxID=355548 RepID=A0A1I0MWJ0_9EURY|nr:hypothetical protein [Halobacterium jilantaiense]SEV93159.1 hypothetical protein SAMN04487945_0432 [Halobacterium jilantaiense]